MKFDLNQRRYHILFIQMMCQLVMELRLGLAPVVTLHIIVYLMERAMYAGLSQDTQKAVI